MSYLNRMANCKNQFQGPAKRVLCVCSSGLLRSPTAAYVLQSVFGFNTRAAGITKEYALIPVDDVLLEWADEIVCMELTHAQKIKTEKPVFVLGIPDKFPRMDPELVEMIEAKYREIVLGSKP